MDIITQRYVELAGKALKQEADAYMEALRYDDKKSIRQRKRSERFFLSEHGQLLSMGNGEAIIRQCREKVEKEKANG